MSRSPRGVASRPDFIGYEHTVPEKRLRRLRGRRPVLGWTIKDEGRFSECASRFDCLIFEGFEPDPAAGDVSDGWLGAGGRRGR
ncbi:MAG: hypothetical protein LBG62_03835 [Candidatus Methanoplasma sp.]|jgi:hypothetical protein|nr:hypothetical protein [Candidatus Methanoplasma sp.]